MNLQINKSDEVNLKLAGKVDNALDFIVDEINVSSKVIGNVEKLIKTLLTANLCHLGSWFLR